MKILILGLMTVGMPVSTRGRLFSSDSPGGAGGGGWLDGIVPSTGAGAMASANRRFGR